jgi:sugar/nucleoside kinase (ribokinase family)
MCREPEVGSESKSDGESESSLPHGSTPSLRLPSPASRPVDYVSYSGLIIDDIVLPDGRTYFNTLGGSATHALIGMRVWSDRLGYFAAVGNDFAASHRDRLEHLGIDLSGLLVRDDYPTARAWQLFEPDERRVEVFRTDIKNFYRLEARMEEMPAAYRAARGFHVCHGDVAALTEVVQQLRAVNSDACIAWEPTPLQTSGTEAAMRTLFQVVDLFSPDLSEAQALTGRTEPREMMDTLLGWGARVVALRMGVRGSRVGTRDGASYQIPAVPTKVIDTTGAGDAYCGGFLVGLSEGADVAEAGARAAASASFAIEQFGVPNFGPDTRSEAERRLAWAQARIEPM